MFNLKLYLILTNAHFISSFSTTLVSQLEDFNPQIVQLPNFLNQLISEKKGVTPFNDTEPGVNFLLANNYEEVNAQEVILEVIANSSRINSIFFFPINEGLPGQYLWWLYPQQIKIVWTENPNEIIITWVSYNNLSGRLAYREAF